MFLNHQQRAEIRKNEFSRKTLLNILNNRGPKVEPYDTPNSTEKSEEDFPKL
jgi:hypothetical protein